MAKASARRKAGLGPPPSRKPAPPVRSKGSTAPRRLDTRTWLIGGLVALIVVLGIVLGIVLSGGGSKSATESSTVIPWASIPGLQTGPPPWNNSSAVLADRLQLLGLSALGAEGTVIHIHEHLDVYVNGKKVSVPALIGIDTSAGFLTELRPRPVLRRVGREADVQLPRHVLRQPEVVGQREADDGQSRTAHPQGAPGDRDRDREGARDGALVVQVPGRIVTGYAHPRRGGETGQTRPT
jgi:hypothetical protein